MDGNLASLERMLRASGQRFKVLDARSMDLLSAFFQQELAQAKIKSIRAPTNKAKAIAFERMNNLASLAELVL